MSYDQTWIESLITEKDAERGTNLTTTPEQKLKVVVFLEGYRLHNASFHISEAWEGVTYHLLHIMS